MKILTNNKITNYLFITSLGLVVILMLSSLVIRFTSPPVLSELDDNVNKINEMETRIQVNVLNACGKSGLANAIKTYLVERGFDVVEIGNFSDTLNKSMIVDRVGDIKSSQQVAYALGIPEVYVTTEIDSSLFVRSTIIVGKDYFELKPFFQQSAN